MLRSISFGVSTAARPKKTKHKRGFDTPRRGEGCWPTGLEKRTGTLKQTRPHRAKEKICKHQVVPVPKIPLVCGAVAAEPNFSRIRDVSVRRRRAWKQFNTPSRASFGKYGIGLSAHGACCATAFNREADMKLSGTKINWLDHRAYFAWTFWKWEGEAIGHYVGPWADPVV